MHTLTLSFKFCSSSLVFYTEENYYLIFFFSDSSFYSFNYLPPFFLLANVNDDDIEKGEEEFRVNLLFQSLVNLKFVE